MILIVGGLGAGKRDFARRELGVREEELSPVLGPGTPRCSTTSMRWTPSRIWRS